MFQLSIEFSISQNSFFYKGVKSLSSDVVNTNDKFLKSICHEFKYSAHSLKNLYRKNNFQFDYVITQQ